MPHAMLYRPYATPNDPSPSDETASAMYASEGVMTTATAAV